MPVSGGEAECGVHEIFAAIGAEHIGADHALGDQHVILGAEASGPGPGFGSRGTAAVTGARPGPARAGLRRNRGLPIELDREAGLVGGAVRAGPGYRRWRARSGGNPGRTHSPRYRRGNQGAQNHPARPEPEAAVCHQTLSGRV